MTEKTSTMTSVQLTGDGAAIACEHDLTLAHSWHHINYTQPKAKKWLKTQPDISPMAFEHLIATDTRPKAIVDGDEVILSLRGMNFNKGASPEEMISIRVWIKDDCMVTSCNRSSRSISYLKEALKDGKGAKNTNELLLNLIDQLADFADQFIDDLEDLLDFEEDNISVNDFERFHPKMNKLRRQIAFVKRYLSPQREALDRLYRNKSVAFTESFYEQLYLQIDKFIFILENLDLVKERALSLQEQYLAFIGHQQNSRLYVLAIISAIFLPLTFLSGLLGMNVGGLPGVEAPYAFWAVSGACLILTVLLLVWFKRKKWF
ncbi:zinc transporter ZntB [Marinicella rhabdoformis]|uniref:zinc transporter ZntB n=1 Tax=Marinicella rhabdoformis TaxID=2580566 RepID=UPI0012AEB419|nr:zinc transporter ZntB [Marinicella rhabdoformis]